MHEVWVLIGQKIESWLVIGSFGLERHHFGTVVLAWCYFVLFVQNNLNFLPYSRKMISNFSPPPSLYSFLPFAKVTWFLMCRRQGEVKRQTDTNTHTQCQSINQKCTLPENVESGAPFPVPVSPCLPCSSLKKEIDRKPNL